MIRLFDHSAGLVICALLASVDVLGIASTGMDDSPPLFVLLLAAALGVVTLAALRPALQDRRAGVLLISGLRVERFARAA
jgi:hypothetical protein